MFELLGPKPKDVLLLKCSTFVAIAKSPCWRLIVFYTYFQTMNKGNLTSDILKSKQHFEILDGLRGVAALAVVIFHFMEWVYTDPSKNFIGHGFLAVDFFFCLSGFVIGYAYDNRIEKMGTMKFFTSRL